jgi:hypothetical protein
MPTPESRSHLQKCGSFPETEDSPKPASVHRALSVTAARQPVAETRVHQMWITSLNESSDDDAEPFCDNLFIPVHLRCVYSFMISSSPDITGGSLSGTANESATQTGIPVSPEKSLSTSQSCRGNDWFITLQTKYRFGEWFFPAINWTSD